MTDGLCAGLNAIRLGELHPRYGAFVSEHIIALLPCFELGCDAVLSVFIAI